MKNKTKKQHFIKICPKCGSIDVQTDFSNPVVWNYGTTAKYKCNSCGHLASTFPEVLESNISNFKKGLREETLKGSIRPSKEDLVDTKPGFYVGVYEITIILIAAILVLVIFLLNRS